VYQIFHGKKERKKVADTRVGSKEFFACVTSVPSVNHYFSLYNSQCVLKYTSAAMHIVPISLLNFWKR
jgi:hypothetical protein